MEYLSGCRDGRSDKGGIKCFGMETRLKSGIFNPKFVSAQHPQT